MRFWHPGRVAGVAWCYRANARGDWQKFIERYACLSLPLALWLVLAYLGTYYLVYFILRAAGSSVTALTYSVLAGPYTTVGYVMLVIVFFTLLRYYVRQVAKGATALS